MSLLLISARSVAEQPADVVPAKVPLEVFFRPPLIAKPALSPSGRYLAVSVVVSTGQVQLAVMDLEQPGRPRAVAGLNDANVASYQWVNDRRLVFDAVDRQSGTDRSLAPGLWAVDRDGTNFRRLVDPLVTAFNAHATLYSFAPLPWVWRLHSVLADGSNDVLVQGLTLSRSWDVIDSRLARLDTVTGATKNLSEGTPDHVVRWVVDREGRPAIVTTRNRGRFGAFTKSETESKWERWQDTDYFGERYADPYWIGFDGRWLAIGRRADGIAALYGVDAKTREMEPEPILALEGYDFRGTVVFDIERRRLVGVHYETDALGTLWLDPVMKAVQDAVNGLLPETVNRIECLRCTGVPTVLVTASSDRQPPRYYAYNRDSKMLTLIAASRPWVKAQEMGARTFHRFAAHDGMSIPVLVTHPPGKSSGPLPAVVLVHGGPWVRGAHWQWDPEAQFLASRGYLVIEPEFRGSQGYGFKHFQAGWKQWGLAMQDDVADALQWAVGQGWVDAKRVCIAGASYGGYAVLMGLIRHHDLYQCGIDWVGVTDISLMYSISWGSDISDEAKGYDLPQLVGDRMADAQQLKDTSPVEQAARVRRPLLLAYGGIDRRVPVEHGKEFKDAVSRTNKDVEYVVYPDEGHGWRKMETRVDFWTRVEKFLERNIGAGAKSPN